MRLINASNPRAVSRPRVLLVSPHSSYRIAPYLQAAQQLGIELLVVSQGKHSVVSEVAAGLHVDFSRPQDALKKILAVVKDHPVQGVVGTDDSTVELACQISSSLGLVHNDTKAASLTRRKDLARQCLSENRLPVPEFHSLSLDQIKSGNIPEMDFPRVVKPLCLSGSRGVIRVNDLQELKQAAFRIGNILVGEECLSDWEKQHVLVEEYIHGPEFAFEGLLVRGRLQRLALFDKPDLMEGPYFEETYYITPSRLDEGTQEQITRRLEQACAAYGLREGPIHAEMRIRNDEVWIMELAARTIGGQCARLLRYGTGRALEEIVLSHAVGHDFKTEEYSQAAGVLMIPIPRAGILRRVEGLLAAQKEEYIEDIEISVPEGYELVPLPESSSYLGFIFARGPGPALVENALRNAYSHLNFVTSPVLARQVCRF